MKPEYRRRSLVARRSFGGWLQQGQQRLINFGSNDYLGLADLPPPAGGESRRAAETRRGGGASPLVTGHSPRHAELTDAIADFEGTEAAVLFATGMAACMGTIATLPRDGDLILSDELNHASLIDGCRLSPAEVAVYPHRDIKVMEDLLRQRRQRYQRVFVVTDSVFSMDGTVAPLETICDLCDRYDAVVIVDEAHATGVLGDRGRGAAEALRVHDRIGVRVGTFSKAFGVQGGFVAADGRTVETLVNRCRTLIYSTALSPLLVESIDDSLQRIVRSGEARQRVQSLSRKVRRHIGLIDEGVEGQVPILPIVIGDDRRTLEAAEFFRDAGLYVPAIRPPTVAEDSSRLRISLSAAHQDEEIERLIETIERWRRQTGWRVPASMTPAPTRPADSPAPPASPRPL